MDCYAPLHHHLWPEALRIEVVSHFQIPGFLIVGLPNTEIDEARERIRAAIEASGLEFPKRRIVMNLSPASVRKSGTGLDFPMALAVLVHHDEELKARSQRVLAWAELGLDGSLHSSGSLLRVLVLALKESWDHLVLSTEDQAEAMMHWPMLEEAFSEATRTLRLSFVSHLKEAWAVLRENRKSFFSFEKAKMKSEKSHALLTLPLSSQRVLETLIAGHHHALFLGPKGVGKTRLADWLEALWIEGSTSSRLERGLAQDLFGEKAVHSAVRRVPSSIRPAGLLGQLRQARLVPGELSRANGGVLIADEFPEWPRDARECLREPLESGQVTLVRAEGRTTLPAQILLFATGNLCPCGEWNGADDNKPCRCKRHAREQYLRRLSGPLLDRIDLVAKIDRMATHSTGLATQSEISKIRQRIEESRKKLIQAHGVPSAWIPATELENLIQAHPQKAIFEGLVEAGSLRSRHKVFRVALTLAALDGKNTPEKSHFCEATFYRAERWLTPAIKPTDLKLHESSYESRSTKVPAMPL